MQQLYDMIYKRKSVRHFDPSRKLTKEDLSDIQAALDRLKPLMDIPVTFRVVKRRETTCMWGEYCLMAYSEAQDGYLLNIGYMMEQMDLFLASKDIGACWYGFGKPREITACDGREFAIMMALGKCKPEKFRKEGAKIRRKPLDVICGDVDDPVLAEALQAAHYAPSACNSQPWRVVCEGKRLEVYRTRGIQSRYAEGLTGYMNKIDLGIFLCFLELALTHAGVVFQRNLLKEDLTKEPVPVAVYQLET